MAKRASAAIGWPCLIRTSLRDAMALAGSWKSAGIDGVLLPVPWRCGSDPHDLVPLDADQSDKPGQSSNDRIREAAAHLARQGLSCHLELVLDRVARAAVPGTARAEWLREERIDPAMDPRVSRSALLTRRLIDVPPPAFVESWRRRLDGWAERGVQGFCFQSPQNLASPVWGSLFGGLRQTRPGLQFIAWTPGLSPQALRECQGAGFNYTVSSLAWWDGKADWLAEEDARLREVAPVLAYVGGRHDQRWLAAAAVSGDGIVLESPLEAAAALTPLSRWRRALALTGPLITVGGHAGRATTILRRPQDGDAAILTLTPEGEPSSTFDRAELAALLPSPIAKARGAPAGLAPRGDRLEAAAGALWQALPQRPVTSAVPASPLTAQTRNQTPRISIEDIQPAVDGGMWPVKRITHEPVFVQATVFIDGHESLSADLCWRACDEPEWQRVPMKPLGNDRWAAQFQPTRIGSHEYCVLAWADIWASFCAEWRAKWGAGQPLNLSLEEGAQWLAHALQQQPGTALEEARWARVRRVLAALRGLGQDTPDEHLMRELLSPTLAAVLRDPGERPFSWATAPLGLWVDRPQARYANWYELFPRSQSAVDGVHGTFDDVIRRLPDIRQMGFDVLYMTPIHPVGTQNRKGRNNSLSAVPEDVGSPYAIGSAEGGHDAIEPQLGTLADFQRLVTAARRQGLEIALDFAIQCSPDHPWLTQHPDWFSWRADGTLRHAENPPKKYEDIVNVTFYQHGKPWRRKVALWRALRDVVLFWIEQGVRIFRVDNPHTKPLPFWHWLITEIHARDAGVVFLSEAFTRPAMMYRLAKAGFTQSYTYFTWRNEPWEIDAYLRELSQPPVADFFRPHFFVNTPDINPVYLQQHGRPGFLVRAALAATGAGLWGIYSGFELCEAAALPGREEYADSEKYELRQRDWQAAGNIRNEITQLNGIRRANPALQGHRGYEGIPAQPEGVLAYLRHSEGDSNVLLVMINLDPVRTIDAAARVGGITTAVNLLTGAREHWEDQVAHARLAPEAPYAIWRLPQRPDGH